MASDSHLNPGDAFPARLSANGNTLVLIPDYRRIFNKSKIIDSKDITRFEDLSQSDSYEYFVAMGLEPDEVSSRILSFMQLTGARLNPDKALFYKEMAKKFPGHEEEAAEAAILLDEKGIPVTEENISQLMGMVSGWCAAGQSFTEAVNSAGDDQYWMVIPYEYKGENPFYGSLCLLKDSSSGRVKRLKITARTGKDVFFFKINLNYALKNNNIDKCSVRFSSSLKKGKIKAAVERLSGLFAGVAGETEVVYDDTPQCLYLSDTDAIALVRMQI